jgi:hypothetical protein
MPLSIRRDVFIVGVDRIMPCPLKIIVPLIEGCEHNVILTSPNSHWAKKTAPPLPGSAVFNGYRSD